MNKIIPFVKMHGLGNDFVIMQESDMPQGTDFSELSQQVADRRMGIGCDQFITYQMQDDVINMGIYNKDGSKALACGNATRCLSLLIFHKTKQKTITLNSMGRKLQCQYHSNDKISVDMGPVSFDKPWMPELTELWSMAQQYGIEPKEMICVDVANPHLVIFSKLLEKDQAVIGRNLQNSTLFPEGVNVSFAQMEGGNITLRVWERGAGFTHACGSGAVATFAAASKLKFVEDESNVIFKYGSLNMKKLGENIVMTGPATYLFDGSFYHEK